MKKRVLLLLLTLIYGAVHAQDNIIKKNGDEIKAKVLEVGTEEIKYKRFENPDGPSYLIKKNEVFMIKYENGAKDIFGSTEVETKTQPAPNQEVTKKPQSSEKPQGYIAKVRAIQSRDPGFRFSAGLGWLRGPGMLNPAFGVDLRLPTKNVFLRGLSFGLRASFYNLDATDNLEIYGGGVNVNYYFPIPVKVIQPYVMSVLGLALYEHWTYQGSYIGGNVSLYGGFGVGTNIMLGRNFGFYTELGYFTTSLVNTGLVVKF